LFDFFPGCRRECPPLFAGVGDTLTKGDTHPDSPAVCGVWLVASAIRSQRGHRRHEPCIVLGLVGGVVGTGVGADGH
jgi:hypothetical protein